MNCTPDFLDEDFMENMRENSGRRPPPGMKPGRINWDPLEGQPRRFRPGGNNGAGKLPPWAIDEKRARSRRPGGKNSRRMPPPRRLNKEDIEDLMKNGGRRPPTGAGGGKQGRGRDPSWRQTAKPHMSCTG